MTYVIIPGRERPWQPLYKNKIFCMTGALVYVRDKDSGTVYLGSDDMPRISYWPSKHDRASMMKVLAS